MFQFTGLCLQLQPTFLHTEFTFSKLFRRFFLLICSSAQQLISLVNAFTQAKHFTRQVYLSTNRNTFAQGEVFPVMRHKIIQCQSTSSTFCIWFSFTSHLMSSLAGEESFCMHDPSLVISCRYVQSSCIHCIQEGHLIMWLVVIILPPLQGKESLREEWRVSWKKK